MRLPAPVHRFRRPRHVVRARHAEAAPARQPAAPLAPARRLLDPVEALRNAVGIDLQVVERPVRRLDQVGAPQRNGVELKLVGDAVEQCLECVAGVDRAVPAHRAAGRGVRVDAKPAVADRAHLVQRVQQRAGIEDRDQPVAAVGTAALHDLAVDGGDHALPGDADPQPDVGLGTAPVGQEAVLARLKGAHGPAGRARKRPGDHLEVQRLDAMAETAPDERLDHPHLRAVDAEALRERQVQVVGHLRRRLAGEAAALGLPGRERSVELDLAVRDLGVVEGLLAHQVRGREARVDVAESLVDLALDVPGLLLVQQHRAFDPRIARAEICRQGLDVEDDRRQRGFGARAVDRRDRGHRFASIADALARDRPFVLRDRNHAIRRGEVLAGDDGAYAGKRTRARRVDAADHAVCDRAAQDHADQHLAGGQVGRVAGAAGHLLDAVDQGRGLADPVLAQVGRC